MKQKLAQYLQFKNLKAQIITEDHHLQLQEFIDCFDNFFLLCEGEKGTAQGILKACPLSKDLSNDKICIGVYEQEKIIAFIDLIQNYPQEKEVAIGYLLVHPKYRSKAIGTKVIGYLSEVLKEQHFEKLNCIVQKQNPKALKFWQNNGFEVKSLKEEQLGNNFNQAYILEHELSKDYVFKQPAPSDKI